MAAPADGIFAAAHIIAVAHAAGLTVLANEVERLGPIVVAPSRHASLADHLYVEVINQQLSVRAADTIWRRILATAAARRLTPGEMFVAGCEEDLRACGVSRRKARTLQAVRAAEAEGLLDPEALRAMDHVDRSTRLSGIWGIGQWTADMVAIFRFLDPDVWPAGDAAAVGVLRRLTRCEDTVMAAAPFTPYRSYLARYMWLSRDSPAP